MGGASSLSLPGVRAAMHANDDGNGGAGDVMIPPEDLHLFVGTPDPPLFRMGLVSTLYLSPHPAALHPHQGHLVPARLPPSLRPVQPQLPPSTCQLLQTLASFQAEVLVRARRNERCFKASLRRSCRARRRVALRVRAVRCREGDKCWIGE
ncbi:hypothetical protein DL93DRAFT_1187075 [Clavulina sp. PMI_390]|nr:hypothetical protein DL93DRAFT_1187075 [Clavulina sp. PMI_390]